MFTVEIKINGTKIGEVYCRNLNEQNEKEEDKYYYEFYRHEKDVIKGYIYHFRNLGAEKLISEIFERISWEIQ